MQFEKDGETVFDFLVNVLNVDPKKIIIMGRSIGSGPATLLARKRRAGALVLFSPLLSVREVASRIPKIGWLAKMFVKSSFFNNGNHIKDIESPIFIIHGVKDEIVPHDHGQTLFKLSTVEHKHLHSVETMTHNSFKLHEDFLEPSRQFLDKIGLLNSTGLPINLTDFVKKYHKNSDYNNKNNEKL